MTRALAAALCLAAVPALAFEGVIETKMTMSSAKMTQSGGPSSVSGTGTISVKGLNSRMEQQMTLPGVTGPMKQVIIHRADEPDTTYIVHEANKTYQKISSDKNDRDESEASKWTVKKLGKDTVAGRSTEHVQVTHEGRGDVMEVWIDKNLVSAGDLEKAFSQGGRGGGGGWWQALKKEGVAGIPLKVVASSSKGEGGVTWEATSVKAQSVPDSAFKVPAGYTESKTGMGGSMNPDQQKQMRDQMMQRLSPEQKKQMEEMMKQHGAGQN
jgi:uncharacterized protein DUF4412